MKMITNHLPRPNDGRFVGCRGRSLTSREPDGALLSLGNAQAPCSSAAGCDPRACVINQIAGHSAARPATHRRQRRRYPMSVPTAIGSTVSGKTFAETCLMWSLGLASGACTDTRVFSRSEIRLSSGQNFKSLAAFCTRTTCLRASLYSTNGACCCRNTQSEVRSLASPHRARRRLESPRR